MPPTCKVDLFVKRAAMCQKLLLKDEQRLCKFRWEQRTAIYKQHMLLQEAIVMAGPMTWVGGASASAQKMALMTTKCTALRKLVLKDQQKLAKKKWELSCCKAKYEAIEPACRYDESK
jgi:hypothetical protein